MGNDQLVRLVKKDRFYLSFKSPRDKKVLAAMRKVDRRDFVSGFPIEMVYFNTSLRIGYGQTCSDPGMVAFMCDVLRLEEGQNILEIGSGCGYHAAVVSHLIGDSGYLTTVERIGELAALARENLTAHFNDSVDDRLEVVHGDGSIRFTENTFDRIYLTAGVDIDSFDPLILAAQLKPGGILLFPQEHGSLFRQTYWNKNKIGQIEYKGVCFVPLIGENT